jgi:hypothetical protein
MPMVSPFSGRLALLDERADEFLKTVAYLGGYCSAEQAQRLGIARSPTQVLAHLRDLERAGFLRKVAGYPVVYQVTKSTTRLLAMDLNARRPHPIVTVRNRLLGVSFYLEARGWPAEFVFDHEQKIALFRDCACPLNLLPRRSGKPYLWEEFILRLEDGRLCVALVDRYHRSGFLQLWGLAQRFCASLEHLGDRLQLLVTVGSEPRYRLYCQLIGHPRLQKLAQGRFEISVSLYRVQRPVLLLRTLLWPDGKPLEKM